MDDLLALPSRAAARIFSYGGGVQSNAVLVLQAQGKLRNPYDVFIFSNVGDDSENPATLDYIEEIAKPYSRKHAIPFIEVYKTRRDGKRYTLMDHINGTERSVPIPARMSNGAPGNRSCTLDFKIRVVDKWIVAEGLRYAVVGLGLSIDEYHRVRDERWHNEYGATKIGFWKRREHPLINLRLSRKDCRSVIEKSGLPMPPKSSCFFCPFKKRSEWLEMRRDQPELFAKAVEVERLINSKRNAIGTDYVYLHPSVTPLENAVAVQLPLFPEVKPKLLPQSVPDDEMDMCESGYCHV